MAYELVETEIDGHWYASISLDYKKRKNINFYNFDAVDWKTYRAYYDVDGDILYFERDATDANKNTVTLIREMVKFIDSDEYKNLIVEDEYNDYIYEIY